MNLYLTGDFLFLLWVIKGETSTTPSPGIVWRFLTNNWKQPFLFVKHLVKLFQWCQRLFKRLQGCCSLGNLSHNMFILRCVVWWHFGFKWLGRLDPWPLKFRGVRCVTVGTWPLQHLFVCSLFHSQLGRFDPFCWHFLLVQCWHLQLDCGGFSV